MQGLTAFFTEPFFQTDQDSIFVRADGQVDHMGFIVVADQLLGNLNGSHFPLHQL